MGMEDKGLPQKLLQHLMPFQREGVEFALSKNGRCMIADEMGLGKTVQAIAVACVFRQEWPLLVVVPSFLKYPWIEELERWIPELQPGDINLVENKTHTMRISSSKVTVLSYGLLTTDARTLVEALTRQRFAVVVVDESHYLKSRTAVRTKLLVPLIRSAKRAILLSGTPALGRPEELFMQIDALYPKRFGSWPEYAQKYCNAHYRYVGTRRLWDCRGASHLAELHERLSEIMIRRRKAEVLSQLPPKVRQCIPFDLPKKAAKEASTSFAKWERLMQGMGSEVAFATEPLLAQAMSLITHMYQQTAVAKAGAVKDYIKMMLEGEKLKFLVFAHHLTMLQACTEAVIEAKAGYIRIDGSVPSAERFKLVHKFQNNPDTRVAILSIQAAGQGLTFTAASHVVFAELYWNPGHMKQAEDRAHRIGQTASVNVHYLIAKGTLDTLMWSILNRKEMVTGSTLNGKKEYLNATVGDEDKWEFLSFADAWTPTELVLPIKGDPKDGVFFTHFEKEKQHDIRSFSLSASKQKKRKRTEDDDASPSVSSEILASPPRSDANTGQTQLPDQDFSPQLKRLVKFRSRFRVKQQSMAGEVGETCEFPCSSAAASSAGSKPPGPRQPPSAEERDQACVVLISSDSEPELSRGKAQPRKSRKGKRSKDEEEEEEVDEPPKDKQKLEEAEEEEDKRQLKGKQSAGERGDKVAVGGSCLPPDHTQDPRAAPRLSSAADANDDDEDDDDGGAAHAVFPGLQFCASQYTDRIYLYSKDGDPLYSSFVPVDIKLNNWDDLPEAFSRRRENRIQVLRFIQEWSRLSAMKQNLLRRAALIFHSPTLGLQQLAATQRPRVSTKRHLSKDEVAQASLSKAQQEAGSVRLVTKENYFSRRRSAASLTPPASERQEQDTGKTAEELGYLQAVDSSGVPLCLFCQKACPTTGGPWDTRFCNHKCQEEFQLRSSQTYMRSRVLEVEQGICQNCGLHAHDLYRKVRDAPPPHRKEILENTSLSQLSLKQLNEMIRAPVERDFWQVDHIQPVYSGGGQCSLDNLQTLCTVCHKARTAQQVKERRESAAASKVA